MPKKSISYHHGSLREACLREALRYVAKGRVDFSLRDLARSLGVSHQAPYHHFKNRDVLLHALAEEGFLKFRETLRAARTQAGTARQAFERITLAYLRFAERNPHHYALMFGPAKQEATPSPDQSQTAPESFQELVLVIELLQAEGYWKNQRSIDVAVSVWSWTHGLAMLITQGQLEWLGFSNPIKKPEFERLFKALESTVLARA